MKTHSVQQNCENEIPKRNLQFIKISFSKKKNVEQFLIKIHAFLAVYQVN